jgi:hypothetical protein
MWQHCQLGYFQSNGKVHWSVGPSPIGQNIHALSASPIDPLNWGSIWERKMGKNLIGRMDQIHLILLIKLAPNSLALLLSIEAIQIMQLLNATFTWTFVQIQSASNEGDLKAMINILMCKVMVVRFVWDLLTLQLMMNIFHCWVQIFQENSLKIVVFHHFVWRHYGHTTIEIN